MIDYFEAEIHDYLLDHMDPARRAAFEQELQRNATLRAALKRDADLLAAFVCDAVRRETLSASDQQRTLANILTAIGPTARARKSLSPRWKNYLWPLAALIVLGLGWWRFEVAPWSVPRRKPTPATAAEATGAAPVGSMATAKPRTELEAGTAAGSPESTTETSAAVPGAAAKEIERLRAQVAELQRSTNELRAEYNFAIRRVTDQSAIERNLSRLTTMELVDPASYQRGDRKGLVDIARSILAAPGIVVAPDGPPPSQVEISGGEPKRPYAWSVFDEKDHRGYLNLYQLPPISTDQMLQVWVRTADSSDFQRAVEVPRQPGVANATVSYTVPGISPPAAILVTIEPRANPSSIPTGTTVLIGP